MVWERKDWGIVLLIVLFSFALFGKVLLNPDQMILPAHDMVSQLAYYDRFMQDSINAGSFPFWNPNTFAGTSYAGSFVAAPFYPLRLPFVFLLPSDLAFEYCALLHVIILGIGAYCLGRSIGMGRHGALVAALVLALSGRMSANLIHAGILQFVLVAAWFPWQLLFAKRTLEDGRWRDVTLLSMTLSLSFLGGHAQLFFYQCLALGAFCLTLLVQKHGWRPGPAYKPALRSIGMLAVAGAVFVMLVGIQLLPQIEFTLQSQRSGGVPFDYASQLSLPPWHLVTAILPDAFGSPIDNSYVGNANFWELSLFCGTLGILLAFYGAWHSGSAEEEEDDARRKRWLRWFLIAILGATLLFALGKYTPLFALLVKIPPFGYFRGPSRALFLAVFAVAMLAGFGMDRVTHALDNKEARKKLGYRVILLACAALLATLAIVAFKQPLLSLEESVARWYFATQASAAVKAAVPLASVLDKTLAVYGHIITDAVMTSILLACCALIFLVKPVRRSQYAAGIIATLVGIELLVFALPLYHMAPSADVFAGPQLPLWLDNSAADYRVLDLSGILPQAVAIRHGIALANGYDPSIAQAYLLYTNKAVGLSQTPLRTRLPIEQYNASGIVAPQFLDALNVRYVLSTDAGDSTVFDVNSTIMTARGPLYILENQHAFSRAALFYNAERVASVTDAMTLIAAGTREAVGRSALVEGTALEGPNGYAPATIVSSTPNTIVITADAVHPAYIFLSENYYPGWRANIDGSPAAITRANGIFMAVLVPEGTHIISFSYLPTSLLVGAGMTTIGLLAITLLFFRRQNH